MLGPERKTDLTFDLPPIKPSALMDRASNRPSERRLEPHAPEDEPGGDETGAAKQALAANLEGMIDGMLRNTQFATAAATKTRSWAQQIGEAAALDASSDDSAFSASSLIADLAQARGGPAETQTLRREPPRRWWIDAVLVMACILSVASAGYFTFAW
jgi:hypothetical protein